MLNKTGTSKILKDLNILQSGHFLLTSGKHSAEYLQCAGIFKFPKYTEELCKQLADKFKECNVDVIIGPAIGAIAMSYEVSRQFSAYNIFAERENNKMVLRRGFAIEKGKRYLIVEDVVTTGGSVKEVRDLVIEAGGVVVGIGCIVDRTAGKIDFNTIFKSLISLDIQSYSPDNCPICKENKIELIKPGSRNLIK